MFSPVSVWPRLPTNCAMMTEYELIAVQTFEGVGQSVFRDGQGFDIV